MTESGDPHTVESKFEREAEYQAPPRDEKSAAVGTRSVPVVDINVLESQQKAGLQTSESIVTDREKTTYTISGKDEEADPENPRATPPGETM